MNIHHGLAFPDADKFMVAETTPDGGYQAAHLSRALTFVKAFRCAVDGGAHIGTWTRSLAARFETVLAFEPSPDTFECLRWNTAHLPNVTIANTALAESEGFVRMDIDPEQARRANTGARYVRDGGDILARPLDAVVGSCDVDFIKLDVEGSEVAALKGATETLRRCRPIVLFEDKGLWKRFGERRDAVQVFLTQQGYKHLARVSCDEIWGPR